MIVPISALVALTTAIDQQALGRGRLAPEFVNRWLPFLALGAAYVLLRWYLFGGPFQVYASRPVVWEVDLAPRAAVGLAMVRRPRPASGRSAGRSPCSCRRSWGGLRGGRKQDRRLPGSLSAR